MERIGENKFRMKNWNQRTLEQKKHSGTIRDFKISQRKKKKGAKQSLPNRSKRSEAMDYITWNLWYWCNDHALTLEQEFKFHPERLWRFDFAIPALKVAIEYEGLMSEKSGHTTVTGYTKDADKYNQAQMLGWKVLRYTALNYKNLLKELNLCLKNTG